MAQCKVLELSFIGNRLCNENEVIEFDGEPGPNLEVIEQAKPAKTKAADPAAE